MKTNRMFRVTALLLALLTVFSVTGCKSEESATTETLDLFEPILEPDAAGKKATELYEAGDYNNAFRALQMSERIDERIRLNIEEYYVVNVLAKKGLFYQAAQLIETFDWPEERYRRAELAYGNLRMAEAGNLVEFGAIDMTPTVWIVLNVEDMEIEGETHKVAYIMTRDVIGTPDGWGTYSTDYRESDLHCWCETSFKMQLRVNLNPEELASVLNLPLQTADGEILTRCFAPSREDIETYLVGDLEQYRKASPTEEAKKNQGLTGEYVSYYLRELGANESGIQYASGVNKDGVIGERFSRSQRAIGGRVCLRVDLGPVA